MSLIRLNKITKTYNIGLQTLVDFLMQVDPEANIEANPNFKIDEEKYHDLLTKKFAEKVSTKIGEIINQNSDKKDGEEDYVPERESVIIDNNLSSGEALVGNAKEAEKATPEQTEKAAPAEPLKAEAADEPQKAETPAEPAIQTPKAQAPQTNEAPQAGKQEAAQIATELAEAALPKDETRTEAAKPAEIEASKAHEKPEPEKEAAEPQMAVETEKGKAQEFESKTQEEKKDQVHDGGTKDVMEAESTKTFAQEAPAVIKAEVPQKKAEQNAERVKGMQNAKAQEAKASQKEQAPAAKAAEMPVSTLDQTPAVKLKVVGKVDLSQFERKPKKRDRIQKGGSQKVDVTKVETDERRGKDRGRNGGGHGKDAQQQQPQGKGRKNRDRGGLKFQPTLSEAELEEQQKQVQQQVKETYAKMNEGKQKTNFGAKYRKEKREAAEQKMQEEIQNQKAEQKVLKVTEFVTVSDLATLMNNTPVTNVIKACMDLGLMVSINQRLDAETLQLVAESFGYKVEFVTADIQNELQQENEPDKEEDLVPRPPIVTVMGHVDHGKTSLLDNIRNTNVIAGEAGGITQHIGAYSVKLQNGRKITFLDTPGHEAFTAMRARGAQMTDLAIIIIAADDAVMPQTIEAIHHAQAAGVPMVFAINKIDKPGAQPEKIYQQLAQMNILTENWGGKFQCQEISAKKGINVDKLLDKVLLETDLMDLKANPNRPGTGAIIESSLDKGRGYIATVLVQNGTIHIGDCMLSGSYYGRIKAMFNERGQKVTEAGPSTPVSILGLNGAPSAGDKFIIMADEKEAKSIANKREQLIRIQGIKTQKHMTLEEIGRRIAIGNFKELNVIVKGDVDGSVEALSDSLIKLSTPQVQVNVIHKAVGAISESDVMLATASDAVIGFQVRPSAEARNTAEKEGIEIRLYSIIYDCINDVKDGIEGMLEPIKKEQVTSTALVKQTFHISKVGTIAGCIIKDGKMKSGSKCRLIRDGIVVYTGELSSLKRGKDDAKEVVSGMECGIGLKNYNDMKIDDVIEAYEIIEVKQTL
jgi:translation initiation factor IF-2